jgi:hypothetical protein
MRRATHENHSSYRLAFCYYGGIPHRLHRFNSNRKSLPMNHPIVFFIHPRCTPDHVGYIPTFLDREDPRPAREQFAERYIYGGWRPQDGFTKGEDLYSLKYPGDPVLHPIASMVLKDETIMIYDHGYVAIWQKGGTFEMCRMD